MSLKNTDELIFTRAAMLLNKLGDQTRPTGLVVSPQPDSSITVKVFVK